MTKLMAAAALLLVAGRAADDELDKAAAKAGEMGNYTCTVTTKMEGGGGGGGGGQGAAQPVEMNIKADAPIHLKSGEVDAYRKGEVLVVKEGETWKKLERQGGGGQGGERPDRRTMAAMRLRGVRAPHEVLKELKSSAFKEVKREDGEGGRVFSGELTEEALKALRPQGRRGGGGGQDRPAPKSTGNAKIWVNGDGAITKYEVHVESTFKNRDDEDVTTKFTSTVEIKEVGSTKYEVPEDAAKLFEARKAEK
jgi:hypothetical protein